MTTLYNGDCLAILPTIPDESIDMILCDPPFGTTRNKWDVVIPLDKLCKEFSRIIKPNGAILIHADQPFTTALITAFRKIWRYELIWVKERGTDFLNANRKPLKAHESVQVCYKHLPTYNPQKTKGKPYKACSSQYVKSSNYGDYKLGHFTDNPTGDRLPTTVLKNPTHGGEKRHPTAKPVALEEWLIKTYSNEGDTVLDPTMGAGSTGVAAVNTNRNFIGIELDEHYFEIAQKRINEAEQTRQNKV